MRRILVLLLASIALVAGCVAPAPGDDVETASLPSASALVPPVPDFDFSTVVDPDHANHQLPALHTGGHGLSLVGHAGLGDLFPSTTRGSITQIDVWGDYAVVSGMEGGLAFAIVDLTDPKAPRPVSWWPSAADGWTARFSDDGRYVFYGCQTFAPSPGVGLAYNPTAHLVGTCEDSSAPHLPGENPAGVVVVDVADKAAPQFVTFLPVGGSHNLFVTSINGTDYVFTASTAILRFDREAGALEVVAEVPGVHDATVAKHPVTGDWLLFTGTKELTIYDVNDPSDPQVVYEAPEDAEFVGWHEQTLIPGLVDGRVVLALGGETFRATGGVPDRVDFLDVTDPASPVLLGSWKPPFEAALPWAGYLYSIHEMAATPTGQLAVAWYHAGVWVLDVSTKERQAEPVTLAAYLPNKLPDVTPSTFAQTAVPYVPFVWGAGWDAKGHLLVPDMHTGVYVLEPDWGLHPAVDSGQ